MFGALASAQSPIESNPVLRAFLASLLPVLEQTEQDRVARFDAFIDILQASVSARQGRVPVDSLQAYISIRNRVYEKPEEAFRAYQTHGILNPFNIIVRPANGQVMQEIVDYEFAELKRFQQLVRQKMPVGQGPLQIQNGVWNELEKIYAMAQRFRDAVDTGSADFVNASFNAAERNARAGLESGGAEGVARLGLGFFQFLTGAGASVARKVGERIVNPAVRSLVFSENALDEMRARILAELTRIRRLPLTEKGKVLELFASEMRRSLNQTIQDVREDRRFRSLRATVPIVDLVLAEFLPSFAKSMSPEQRNRLIWSVFSYPDFFHLPEEKQVRIVAEAIGPTLPYLMRIIAKHPEIASGGPLARLLCCQSPEPAVHTGHIDRLRGEFTVSFANAGYKLISIEPQPVSVTPLKESYRAVVSHNGVERTLLLQIARPGVRDALVDEIATLRRIENDNVLIDKLAKAGLPPITDVIETMNQIVSQEIDFSVASELQAQAARAYSREIEARVEGRPLKVEIAVPEVVLANSSGAMTVFAQQYASGVMLKEAREGLYAQQVSAALSEFAKVYLQEAFKTAGTSFVWSTPSEENMRVEIAEDGSRVRLTLLNFGSAHTATPQQVKELFGNFGRLPLLELQRRYVGGIKDFDQAKEMITRALDAGFKFEPRALHLAEGLLNLKTLVGEKVVRENLIRIGMRHPGLLWNALRPSLAQWLKELVERLKFSAGFQTSKKPSPADATMHPACKALFAVGP